MKWKEREKEIEPDQREQEDAAKEEERKEREDLVRGEKEKRCSQRKERKKGMQPK